MTLTIPDTLNIPPVRETAGSRVLTRPCTERHTEVVLPTRAGRGDRRPSPLPHVAGRAASPAVSCGALRSVFREFARQAGEDSPRSGKASPLHGWAGGGVLCKAATRGSFLSRRARRHTPGPADRRPPTSRVKVLPLVLVPVRGTSSAGDLKAACAS